MIIMGIRAQGFESREEVNAYLGSYSLDAWVKPLLYLPIYTQRVEGPFGLNVARSEEIEVNAR